MKPARDFNVRCGAEQSPVQLRLRKLQPREVHITVLSSHTSPESFRFPHSVHRPSGSVENGRRIDGEHDSLVCSSENGFQQISKLFMFILCELAPRFNLNHDKLLFTTKWVSPFRGKMGLNTHDEESLRWATRSDFQQFSACLLGAMDCPYL
jgi:hypothetical protein